MKKPCRIKGAGYVLSWALIALLTEATFADATTCRAPVSVSGGLPPKGLAAVGVGGIAIGDSGASDSVWFAYNQNSWSGEQKAEGSIGTVPGPWRNPKFLPSLPHTANGITGYPAPVFRSSSGIATVVWENSVAIWTSDTLPGSEWQKPTVLAPNTGNYVDSFAADRTGDDLVAWSFIDSQNRLQVSFVARKAGAAWTAPAVLSLSTPIEVVYATVGSSGAAAIAGFDSTNSFHILTAPAVTGPWSDSATLPKSKYASGSLAIDASGRIAFATYSPAGAPVAYIAAGPSSAFSGPKLIASDAYFLYSQLASDDAGNLTILYSVKGTTSISAANSTFTGAAWTSTPVFPQTGPLLIAAALNVAPGGNAVAAISYSTTSHEYTRTSVSTRASATASWSTPVQLPNLSNQNNVDDAAINNAGQAGILWYDYPEDRQFVSACR